MSPLSGAFRRRLIVGAVVALAVLGPARGAAQERAADAGRSDRHQSLETATISYNFIGHTRFGGVEWRPEMNAH